MASSRCAHELLLADWREQMRSRSLSCRVEGSDMMGANGSKHCSVQRPHSSLAKAGRYSPSLETAADLLSSTGEARSECCVRNLDCEAFRGGSVGHYRIQLLCKRRDESCSEPR